MPKQVRQGFYGVGRTCAECKHGEYSHYPNCLLAGCACRRFSARKLSASERRVQAESDRERSTADEWTGDPYTEFTEHLYKVMKGD